MKGYLGFNEHRQTISNVVVRHPERAAPTKLVPIYVNSQTNLHGDQFESPAVQRTMNGKLNLKYEKRKLFGVLSQNPRVAEEARNKFSSQAVIEKTLKMKEEKLIRMGQRTLSMAPPSPLRMKQSKLSSLSHVPKITKRENSHLFKTAESFFKVDRS